MKYITNIFPIENLHEISSQYRLLDIKGLKKSSKDYQSAKQFLIQKFSIILRHPVTIIEINDEPKMVIKNDTAILNKIKTEYDFGRIYIHLNPTDTVFDVDFVNPNSEVKKICLRFLQFDLNGELKKNPNLWQPGTGEPFFLKEPEIYDGIAMYKGFIFRVVELPTKGFGIAIDSTRKFASASPMPYYLTQEQFKRYKNKTVIYQYKDWYEIKAAELDDFNVTERKIDKVSLIDFVRNEIPKPHSPLLANLPNDGSAIVYYTSSSQSKAAPAGLCYEVMDFQDTHNSEVNRKSIIRPGIRFAEIMDNRRRFFASIKFGNKILKLSDRALEASAHIHMFPSFELGNGNILSIKDFKEGEFNLANRIAKTRMNRLMNQEVGFYTKSPLPNQIIVLPRSINDSTGNLFVKMLSENVNQMYPSDKYTPEVISYEDKFKQGTDYLAIGKHIIEAVKSNYRKKTPCYGVIMIPRLEKKAKREHDKLSALIIRELKPLGFHCSIIHTDTINTCFETKYDNERKPIYRLRDDKRNKFNGYLKNVAINKVLLNCSKWPFVLNESLHADLTIGIDVKHHTAGFTIIDKHGKNIRTELDETSNKEKLSSDQLKTWLYKIVKDEYEIENNSNISNIVIHRDGRVFEPEVEGLLAGLQKLKDDMIVGPDTTINIVEIPKSSFFSVRLFAMGYDSVKQKPVFDNPPIGLHFFIQNEAFLCSTGKEFQHDGTSKPLYVKYNYGTMKKEDVLSDLFKLTTLAFTKPDDCSRVPLTIKINDMKLSDAATEYDEDAYRQLENLKTELNLI